MKYVVLGAGAVGTGAARLLAEAGHDVVLASRSGPTNVPDGVRGASVDASDTQALTALARGAEAVVNAMNPPNYTQWERDWPPIAAAVLAAAEQTGAGVVLVGNLYAYGEVDGPITEDTPLAATGKKGLLRKRMWDELLAAHTAGRIRATELRGSDYFGPGARPNTSVLNQFVIAPTVRGGVARLPFGNPSMPRSWTYLPDAARLAAILATDDRGWGRAWHVPSPEPLSMIDVAERVAALAGTRSRVTLLPGVVRWLARVAPIMRELDETAHQFAGEWVLDSSAAQQTFGLAPTSWDDALPPTVSALAP